LAEGFRGRILVIAGSDSGGGAGIQADIKAAMALGAYATTAITAVTAQNTLGVQAVHAVPLDVLRQQIAAILSDIGADAVKTGMLGDAPAIELVAEVLTPARLPFVLDPVMVAKGGASLLAAAAVATLIARLMPLASVITPNVPEAEVLTGMVITTIADMREAAAALMAQGARAVLLKGGHLGGGTVTDLLATSGGVTLFEHPRIDTQHTHGTGCTLATAVAAGLAQGMPLLDAVSRARRYVQAAIMAAPGLGGGHGPLNHAVWLNPLPIGATSSSS
jgi:hydroxymethylpyrimidine/phosphomethylpyrimidine kinase